MSWQDSPAALRIHDAAYAIECAWEDDSRSVTRELCSAYHAALEDALPRMPAEGRAREARRLRGWAGGGVLPLAGKGWALAIAATLLAEGA